MSDSTNQNTHLHDEDLLEAGDETLELEEGAETPALTSGDDLAKAALGQAQQMRQPGGTNTATQQKIGETLMSLQNIIERNVEQLDEIKAKMKQFREELTNIFDNDATLSEAVEQATQITQKVKEQKSRVQSSPQVNQIKANITELSEQKKEIEEALNNHLLNIYQLTGTQTYDTSAGVTREFSVRATIKGNKKP